jgi:hypothetical protein
MNRIGKLNPNHRPDYTNTEPPFDIPPNPSWFAPGKIVALDPWGHLSPQIFRKEFEEGKDIRPTIGECASYSGRIASCIDRLLAP